MANQNGSMGSNQSSIGSELDQKIDTLKEKARGIVDQSSAKVDELKTRVGRAKDDVMARSNAFLDRATELIKAHPLKSVGIAFGVGYIGMRLFRR